MPEPPCSPQTLASLLDLYRRSEERLTRFDLLRAITEACYQVAQHHQEGRIHGQLSPRHVVLEPLNRLALIGWSEGVTSREMVLDLVDLPYQAPERVASDGIPTPASDIHALGGILYECLTFRPPYAGASREEIVAHIRKGMPWPPGTMRANIAPPLEAICLKALEPLPAQRYASAAEFARDIERFLAGDQVHADGTPPDRWSPWFTWFGSRRGLLTLGMIFLGLAGTLAVAIHLFRVQRSATERANEANMALQQQSEAAGAELRKAKSFLEGNRAAAGEVHHLSLLALRNLAKSLQPVPGETRDITERLREPRQRLLEDTRRLARATEKFGAFDRTAGFDHTHLATLFLQLGQVEEARVQAERAVAIYRILVRIPPPPPIVHREHLEACRLLATVLLALNQGPAAREALQEGLQSAEALRQAQPGEITAHREVTATLETLGSLSLALNNHVAARETFAKMVLAIEGYPGPKDLPLRRLDRSGALAHQGEVEVKDHEPAKGLTFLQEALKEVQALEKGADTRLTSLLEARKASLQRLIEEACLVKKAIEDVDVALSQPDGVAQSLLLHRAIALIRQGKRNEAADTAERLRAFKSEDSRTLYNAACCFSLCAEATKGEEQAGYRERALTVLREAIQRGWRNATHTERDPDWAALRGEERFRRLLHELRHRESLLTIPILP